MAREERRGSSLRRRLVLAAVVLLFLILLMTSLFGRKGLIEIHKARKSYAGLLEEIKALEARKSQLLKDIRELERDPQAVEKEAREKLWLMKPDEKVIVKKKPADR